ncbi:hypothetical protein A2U01_0102617, partial [Trifolium medium]|nr:hypothetical protein [Trifolium medium]
MSLITEEIENIEVKGVIPKS